MHRPASPPVPLACAVRAIATRLPDLDDQTRHDVAGTALESMRRSGLAGRTGELAALAGLMLQLASRRQTGGRPSRIWVQGVLAGALYAAATGTFGWLLAAAGGGALAAGAALVLGVVVPLAALSLARLDPRVAVAVLALWLWHLVLTDVRAAVHAVTSWSTGADDGLLLARWCLMASGVAVAWLVLRRVTRAGAPI